MAIPRRITVDELSPAQVRAIEQYVEALLPPQRLARLQRYEPSAEAADRTNPTPQQRWPTS